MWTADEFNDLYWTGTRWIISLEQIAGWRKKNLNPHFSLAVILRESEHLLEITSGVRGLQTFGKKSRKLMRLKLHGQRNLGLWMDFFLIGWNALIQSLQILMKETLFSSRNLFGTSCFLVLSWSVFCEQSISTSKHYQSNQSLEARASVKPEMAADIHIF